ncbi:MAG: dynamin family protein [Pseudonocardiales bacterium]
MTDPDGVSAASAAQLAQSPAQVLRSVCRDGARRARGARLRTQLLAIADQLDLPLQLAFAGAVSAGKSTLVNAVLGRPVAPADAGECTRLVTWYEYGRDDGRVLVECRSGGALELRLDGAGRLPAVLGVPAEEVVRLRVQLDEPRLRALTVIDTPGINTVSAANEEATRRLLFGDAAAEHAQALIYVLRYVQRFDADTLGEFRSLSAACGMAAVNTAAVLSQIDRRADEDDPWPTARRLTDRAAAELRGVVLDVAPVIGLLAETARGRLLGPAEVAGLRTLAGLPADQVDDLLLDLVEFADADEPGWPVPVATRRALAARLHRYGIREAVGYLRRHPTADADALHRWLAERSGFDPGGVHADPSRPTVSDVLARFARHAEQLKAFAAMIRVRELANSSTAAGDGTADRGLVAELLTTVDENRPLAAGLRGLRILAAVAALGRGQLRLDDAMTAELLRLARGDAPATQLGLPADAPPADVRSAVVDASRRWRRAALLAGPTVEGHRLHDVLGALEDIAAELSAEQARRTVPSPMALPPMPPPPMALPPTQAGPAQLPQPDRQLLTRLLASPLLGELERDAVGALLDATGVGAAVGVAPGSSQADIAARAAELAGRFRVLLHRPLPGPDRRAVQAVCDAFETIVHGIRKGI